MSTKPETIAAQRLAKLREAWSTRQIDYEHNVVVLDFGPAEAIDAIFDQPAPESKERNTALREAVSGFLARWGGAMDRQKPRLYADVVDAMRIAFDAPESNKCE